MPCPIDFTAHFHPVAAVPCPVCRAGPGRMCQRPSGHRASDFHHDRKTLADVRFIAQRGPESAIWRLEDGWEIETHPKPRLDDLPLLSEGTDAPAALSPSSPKSPI